MKETVSIRWHGRGGQGAKTAALLLAQSALEEGKYSQGYPDYGPERMGAPMRGFNRISTKPILLHSAIENPDIVIVLDETLLEIANVSDGLTDDGVIVVNTQKTPKEIRELLKLKGAKVHTIDATKISIDELGKPIPNAPMIGALLKVTGLLNLDIVKKNLRAKFEKKFKSKIVEGNINAIQRAYEEVKGE